MNGYVLVKGIAGLGNRMLSAMTGILYAMLSDRKAVIDWTDRTYSSSGENVFQKLFVARNSVEVLPHWALDSVNPPLWAQRMGKSSSEVIDEIDAKAYDGLRAYRKFSFDFSRIDHSEKTLVMWSYNHLIPRLRKHFRGQFTWLSSKTDEEIISWLLHSEMLLHPDIAKSVEQRWRSLVSQENIIGVHIRHTDRKLPLAPYFKAIDELLQRAPGAEMFLATDNIGVQSMVIERYKKVVYNKKWFPAEGEVMHLSKICPDRTQNAIDALLDMYMLSKCRYLVFAGSSTFSYMSSLITTSPRSDIINVEQHNPVIQFKRALKRAFV